ncbi:hypothetical protein KIP69_03540 [Geobacter sulfurreducens]|uniref:hypothetical protein n=1 Tax=Geobacter sulfurreducens TaxID=35554 RepID=UPI001BDCACD9|nr:hypothetical protein [Geobacter sulfurreducens]QVW35936.1 hypothetical protein KIP69_03540 [Geobacter sulfurreducens]
MNSCGPPKTSAGGAQFSWFRPCTNCSIPMVPVLNSVGSAPSVTAQLPWFSTSKNREYKDAWPLYQVMIDEIFFIKTNKNLTYSHRHACMEVAKQIGEKGFNKVHWKTVEQHTINPKSKNK